MIRKEMMIRRTQKLRLRIDSLIISSTCGLCPEFLSTICAWSIITTLYVPLLYFLHFKILWYFIYLGSRFW